MSQINWCVPLATLLAAGCASAPERQAKTAQAAQDGTATTMAAETGGAASVLELHDLAVDPGQLIACRDMLRPASNVIVTQCMTGDDWKRYERQQERWAREMLRMMQRSAYR